MDPSAPRVVIVGAGRMGCHHAQAIARAEHLHLAGIVESDSSRHEPLARQFRCVVASDLEDVVARTSPQAAIVATPDDTHVELASRAIGLGLHVLVEKPLAPSPGPARDLVEFAHRSGSMLLDGLVERFNPAWSTFLRHISLVGTPIGLEVVRRGRRPTRADSGVLLDLGIHDLDLLHRWLGALPEHLALASGSGTNSLCLETRRPFPMRLRFGWDAPETERQWHLEGIDGRLTLDLQRRTVRLHAATGEPRDLLVASDDPLEAEHAAFRVAILDGSADRDALARHLEILEFAATRA